MQRKRGGIYLKPACSRLSSWTDQVRFDLLRAWGDRPLLTGPVWVGATYFFARPKYHYTSKGDIKPQYRDVYPTIKPDLDKLDRAIFDALTGIVYRDDAQVVGRTHYHQADIKVYARGPLDARCELRVEWED